MPMLASMAKSSGSTCSQLMKSARFSKQRYGSSPLVTLGMSIFIGVCVASGMLHFRGGIFFTPGLDFGLLNGFHAFLCTPLIRTTAQTRAQHRILFPKTFFISFSTCFVSWLCSAMKTWKVIQSELVVRPTTQYLA